MDKDTSVGEYIATADSYLRRILAGVLGVFIALVVATLILAEAGVSLADNLIMSIGFAILGVLIWRYAQRDQYRAEASGDKALIVTSLAEDIVLTGAIIYLGGIGIGLFSPISSAVVHAGGAGGAVAYYIGRRIWVGVDTTGDTVRTL